MASGARQCGRRDGARSIQVLRRMRALIDDVRSVAPPERREVLDAELAQLDAILDHDFGDARDRATARTPSVQGHGPAV